MHSYVFNNVDDAAKTLASDIRRLGTITPNYGTLEILNVSYCLRNPLERIISFQSLKQYKIWTYCEVLTEFLGINPPMMESFLHDQKLINMMESFHRGDGRANYTYGERWHNNQSFQRIIKRLQRDKYSRQAVMNIWDSSLDLNESELNVPCTIIHQFLIRPDENGIDKMHLSIYMRSNDLFSGWKYDTFLNSFLLEAFAGFLNCEVGTLNFYTGSLHVYSKDFEKLETLVNTNEFATPSRWLINKPKTFCLSFDNLYKQLRNVYQVAVLSAETNFPLDIYIDAVIIPYFKEWARDFVAYSRAKGFKNSWI